jgi:hypothetical protein
LNLPSSFFVLGFTHGVEPQSEAYRAMSGHKSEGAPHRPLNSPGPLGLEGGEGAEPKWRHVDVEPNWKAAEEWKEPEEEEEVKGKVRVKALYCDDCKSLTNHGFLGYHYAAAEYCCFSCGRITLEYLDGKMRGVVISEERFVEFMDRFGEIAEAATKALELLKKLDVEFVKVWEIMNYVIEAKAVAESWRDIMASEARYHKIRG